MFRLRREGMIVMGSQFHGSGTVRQALVLVLVLGGMVARAAETRSDRHEFEALRMGIPVRIILYCDDAEKAHRAADSAFGLFEKLNGIMSDYDSDSELSQITVRSVQTDSVPGPWIPLSDDLFNVLKASRRYSELSHGAFEVSISPLVRLWRRSRRQHRLPKPELLERAKERVGSHLWELDEQTRSVRLHKKGVRFDLGAIAKGYAIDRAFETILTQGITRLLVDAGGDMRLGDAPPDSPQGWRIDLDAKEFADSPILLLRHTALATSGDRFRHTLIDGVRYSHIINPKTGLGLTRSSTVYVSAPTAMEADAYASILSILDPTEGLKLIDEGNGLAATILFHDTGQVLRSKRDLSSGYGELPLDRPN